MVDPRGATSLHGWRAERVAIDALVERMREGGSGVLVVVAEAGIGATARLEHAIASASDLAVLPRGGVESEMELAFGAPRHLFVPLLSGFERPAAQQPKAFGVAFGFRARLRLPAPPASGEGTSLRLPLR